MLKSIRSASKGRKLANGVSKLCGNIINNLIVEGFAPKLPDTAYIFQECFAYCTVLSMNRRMGEKGVNMMVGVAKDISKDWLCRIWSEVIGIEELDTSVESVINVTDKHTSDWIKELGEEKPKLIGLDSQFWIPAATYKFVRNLSGYVADKFGDPPDEFAEFLTASAELSLNELVSMKYIPEPQVDGTSRNLDYSEESFANRPRKIEEYPEPEYANETKRPLDVALNNQESKKEHIGDTDIRRSMPKVTEVKCWSCKATLEVTDKNRGRKIKCPDCRTKQKMPS